MKTLQIVKQFLARCWRGILTRTGRSNSPLAECIDRLKASDTADIAISGNGFYSIQGVTESGREWVCSLVDGADANGLAYTDTSNFARAIADGALADGLSVTVNDQAYAGVR